MKPLRPTSETRRAVVGFIQDGYMPVPIPKGEKAPILRGWTKLRVSKDQVSQYFAKQENVGLLLGKPSRGLVDVDLDAPEAAAVAESFLPATGMIHGREGKPSSHWWYRVGNALAPQKFTDVDGSCLLEIRSTGQQTLAPPSTHPSGQKFRWEKNEPPKKVKAEKLIRSATLLAAAALLIRHWPEPGSRNEFTLALAGAC